MYNCHFSEKPEQLAGTKERYIVKMCGWFQKSHPLLSTDRSISKPFCPFVTLSMQKTPKLVHSTIYSEFQSAREYIRDISKNNTRICLRTHAKKIGSQ
jgi:hypothetical protein